MKTPNGIRRTLCVSILSLLLLSLSAHSSITNSTGKLWKAGYVGARNLVLGPNGQPIYAEIDEFGNVLQQYGEAMGALANAQIISGDQYRRYFSRLEQLKKANPGLTIQRINNKSQLLSANGDLLLEAPVDFNAEDPATTQNTTQTPSPAGLPINSVLINEQGIVVHRTTNRIAFRVAMFGAGDGSDLGSANDSNIYRGSSNNRLLGPMIGSRVQYGSRAINTAFTGLDGYYYIDVQFPPCPNFNMTLDTTMKMDLQYTNFNPRAAKPFNTWYFTSPTRDTCVGLDQVAQGIVRTAIQSIQNSTASVDYYNNFIVDLIMISGQNNRLVKLDGSTIPLADTTEYALNPIDYVPLALNPNLDLDGDGITDKQALRSDGQIAVYLNGRAIQTDAAGQPINEDLLRQADTQAQRNGSALKPEQQHQGLLKQISETDLIDTDILTYREANGALVTERNKLQMNRVVGIGKGTSFGAGLNTDGSLYYNPVVWTEYKIDNAFEVSAFSNQPAANQQVNNSPSQFNSIRDIIRPGEFIKTVIINRASGYIGTQSAQIKSNANTAGNTLGTLISPIELRPPNLKIKVERHHKAKTRTGNKLKDIDNIIGFEGSGLTTDTLLVITTEWYDQDGSPLPDDLPGYTARLAKVVRNSKPGATIDRLQEIAIGSFVAQFDISPGTHTQSIYIPEDNQAEHFYIHISGQPIDRQSDFSVKGTQGILGERPAKYVPFKVAIYDEATTNKLKRNARKSGADPKDIKPVYNWVYRPEMQLSVFDLEQQQLQFQSTTGNAELIDLSNTAQSPLNLFLADDLSYVDLLYDLTGSAFDPLERFSGDRELIFSIGGEEELATITSGGVVRFNDSASLSQLEDIDLLTIRLYQNNDMANVLWEFAFGNGLNVISSSNQGSRDEKSFVIRGTEDPIKVQWLAELKPADTIQWKIETLSGLKNPNVPDGLGNLTNENIKKTMYGQIQAQSFKGANAGGNGTGQFGTPWLSDVRTAGTNAQQRLLKEIWFRPDMSGEPHPQWKTSEDGIKAHMGTTKIDVWHRNPRVGYKVTVYINGQQKASTTIRMDRNDMIRQEYIDHLGMSYTNSSGNTYTRSIPVPEREMIISIPATPSYFSEGVWSESEYGLMMEDQMFELAAAMNIAFDARKVFYNQSQNTLTDIIGNTLTFPNAKMKLNSGYRNPERQEFFGTAINSKHQLGNAVDLGFSVKDYFGDRERAALYQVIWEASSNVTATFKQLEEGGVGLQGFMGKDNNQNGLDDAFEQADHLHIQ